MCPSGSLPGHGWYFFIVTGSFCAHALGSLINCKCRQWRVASSTSDFGPAASTHLTYRNDIPTSVCAEKETIPFEHHLSRHVAQHRACRQWSLKLSREHDMMTPLGLTRFSYLIWCTSVWRFMLELTGLQSRLSTELDFSEVNFYIYANSDLELNFSILFYFIFKLTILCFPLGCLLFFLQGPLDDPSAGREWLQISHRFHVLQLSLEHLEGQDTELKSSPCFSVSQLQFCLVLFHQCCAQKLLLLKCQGQSDFLKQGLIEEGGIEGDL